jgi:hypothetical protein
MHQNDYSVAFGWLVAWKIKTFQVAISAEVALECCIPFMAQDLWRTTLLGLDG